MCQQTVPILTLRYENTWKSEQINSPFACLLNLSNMYEGLKNDSEETVTSNVLARACERQRGRCVGDVLFFVSVSLKLFVGGGRVGRPLGKLMCMQLCVRSHMCVCAPALASLLPSLQPPHSDSPVTEGLTTSHALPINSPAPLASLYL